MKLYLISQSENNDYDTYDSAVVAAESPEDARTIHPIEPATHDDWGRWSAWVQFKDIDKIKVEYLGETKRERGVVLASFNAG